MKKDRLKQVLFKLKSKFQTIEKGALDYIARATGFVQRKTSKLSGRDFFHLMTAEHFSDAAISLQGLCDSLRTIKPKAVLSPQALHQRINSKSAVSFMKEVFANTYKKQLAPIIDKITLAPFKEFNRVFLQDSTQIELSKELAEDFKGSGGGASTAAMKIDLIYELKQSIVERLTISEGTAADQKKAEIFLDIVRKGDLIIRDLGYFVMDVFEKIAEKEAYYLSRYRHLTKIDLGDEKQSKAVDPLGLIQKNLEGDIAEAAIFFREAETAPPSDRL